MKVSKLFIALALALGLSIPALGDDSKSNAEFKGWLAESVARYKMSGWTGIETHKLEKKKGYYSKITRVVPGSPAEVAGLKVGDVLFAINGVQLSEDNLQAIKHQKKGMRVGSSVSYSVKRKAGDEWVKETLKVTLGEVPQDVLASRVGHLVLKELDVKKKMAKN